MKYATLFICLFLFFLTLTAHSQKLADPVLLWPAGAPGATGVTDEDKPAIIPFIPEASKRNGAAVLVIPGGAFTTRATDHEGVLVAQWLKERGITAFLLRYRLKPLYSQKDWLRDGQRGIQFLRSHAEQYQISANRIGAIGFSAGAEIATDMSFHPLPGNNNSTDPVDQFSARPDFMILAYGSMQKPASLDASVLKNFPPTFMYCTAEDAGHMNGMIDLYADLFREKIPIEGHFFRNGEHGTGFAKGDPILGQWPKLMYNWLKAGGFLTANPRFSLSGLVRLNKTPLVRGMVILIPEDLPNAPSVVVYITNSGTGQPGKFSVPMAQGPIAGKYRVEVRQDATRWISNSRDPFMIRMIAKQHQKSLTDNDISEWSQYLRKRDLSPSIYNQRVFFRQHPGDKKDYVVTITDSTDLILDVFSKKK